MAKPRIIDVAEGVWCVQRIGYLSCSYIVVRDHGTYLIDAGIDVEGRDMQAGLAAAARSVEDVRAILLTHWHNDHSSGAAALQAQSQCEILHHRSGAPKLTRAARSRGWRGWLANRLPDHGWLAPTRALLELAPLRAIQATRFVGEGDLLYDAFEVWETPGHTADHLSFYLRDARILFTGDAIAVVGDSISFMAHWLTDDVEAARASMLRCVESDVLAYCPGHRAPLVGPTAEHRRAVAEYTRSLRKWPLYGCKTSFGARVTTSV